MRLRPSFLLITLVALATLAVALGARRLAATQTQRQATRAALEAARADAARVVELRAAQQVVAENRRPDQDVIRRVNDALAAAGILQDRFAGLRPASDLALAGQDPTGPQYRRQSVQVTLARLGVGELGAFLAAWSQAGEIWTPTQIDLKHVRDRDDPARYNLTMVISATYVADP